MAATNRSKSGSIKSAVSIAWSPGPKEPGMRLLSQIINKSMPLTGCYSVFLTCMCCILPIHDVYQGRILLKRGQMHCGKFQGWEQYFKYRKANCQGGLVNPKEGRKYPQAPLNKSCILHTCTYTMTA